MHQDRKANRKATEPALLRHYAERVAAAAGQPPAAPRSPRLNWGWVATQIAQGRTPNEIAAELGCSPARIWRNYRRSKRFHDRIERERRETLQQVAWRLTGKAPQILDGLLAAIDAGDLRLLLQLADRLKLQTAGQDINIVDSPW